MGQITAVAAVIGQDHDGCSWAGDLDGRLDAFSDESLAAAFVLPDAARDLVLCRTCPTGRVTVQMFMDVLEAESGRDVEDYESATPGHARPRAVRRTSNPHVSLRHEGTKWIACVKMVCVAKSGVAQMNGYAATPLAHHRM